MSLKIPCPNCGLRPHSEFSFGGEQILSDDGDVSADFARVFLRDNAAGIQEERWFHLAGCRRWLTIRRDTLTDQIIA